MLWTICILTIPGRKTELERIVGILEYQIANRSWNIQILIADQDWGVAEKRQWCLDNAQGLYVNFIDDDDLVAHDYIDSILPLLDGTDYIGFRQQYYLNGKKGHLAHHSLQYKDWYGDHTGWHRDVSHLNPILRSVALQGSFIDGPGEELSEDDRWAKQVNPQTEHFIDKTLYFYFDESS